MHFSPSTLAGLGFQDEFALANPSNPCAPGLHLVNGSCFRSPGSDGNPVAGPVENLDIAARILGGGATCRTERVDVGPYAYEQNICRDPGGNILGGADNIAEHAFVEASLRNPGNPVLFTAIPESHGPAPVPSPAAKPNQSTPPRDQPGTTALPPVHNASVTDAARETAAQQESAVADPGDFLSQIPTAAWVAIAAGVGFIFMSMSKGSR
jgi:hypothetical protein